MSDTVQQIKERLDVAGFIRTYVQLSPAGKNLKGLCPFHKEKTPSFIVSPDRQIWHCFGCSAGGDLIGFVMRYENVEFFEALKILAEKAGIDIGRVGTQDQRHINLLYEINRAAKEFFRQQLILSSSKGVIDYLKSRGLKPETIEEFEIGFAPDQPDALSRYLMGAGYNVSAIEKAGLIIKTERGTYRDRFRNRIMFPLANQFGKIVGFTGRIMPGYESENIGKYVNSPETPIFNKSKILYGLDKSKNFIRENRTAVLVEGQMDFLMSWQDGIKNLAATSGTALTLEHLKSLKRIADHLILSFDQDEAGQMATERTIDLAGSADLSAKVLLVPPDLKIKDPADIALAHPGILKTLAEKAQPAMEYYFERYKIGRELPVAELKKNARIVLAKIKSLYSAVERAHWLKQLAGLTGIGETHLSEEMENLPPNKLGETRLEDVRGGETGNETQSPPLSRQDLIGQRIVSLVLNQKDFYQELLPKVNFLPVSYQKILSFYFDNRSLSLPPELQALADLVSLRSGLEFQTDAAKSKKEFTELIRQVQLEHYKERQKELHALIAKTEKLGGDAIEFLLEKQKISNEMKGLDS